MLRTNQHEPAASAPATSQEQAPARTTAEAWGARQLWGCHGHAPAMDDAARLADVAAAHPDLGLLGWRLPGVKPEAFTEQRNSLVAPNAVRQFAACRRWLEAQGFAHTKAHAVSSYGLKEYVESAAGIYVTSGVMSAAALSLGYRVEPSHSDKSPNGRIYLSVPRAFRRKATTTR